MIYRYIFDFRHDIIIVMTSYNLSEDQDVLQASNQVRLRYYSDHCGM